MIVTKTAFADMAGIDKSTVTVSLTRGKLRATPDGYIDTEQPENAIYLATRRQKGKAPPVVGVRKPRKKKAPIVVGGDALRPAREAERKAARAALPLTHLDGVELGLDDTEGDDEGLDELDKLKADVRLKNAQSNRHELKYAQDKKLVIPLDLVDKMNAKARDELKTRLQDMPRRLTARMVALLRSGSDEKEVQTMLEREIDDTLRSFAKVLEAGLD